MKFIAVFAGALALIGNVHAQETGTSVTSAAVPVPTADSAFIKCLEACDPADTSCRAQCAAVPFPNQSQVNATIQCVANCDQGKGSAADIKKYVECRDACIEDNYLTTGGAGPTGTSGSNPSGTSGSNPTGSSGSDSDDGDSDNGDGNGDGEGNSDGNGDSDGAASTLAMSSSLALVAVLAAVFAL